MSSQADLFPSEKPQIRRFIEPIARDALVEDGCRYWLKRAWGAGPMICWVMCNPSDADASKDDPTMLRVMDFSARWGFGSCVVINPIPVISSTPAKALEWAEKVGTMDYLAGDPIFEQWNSNIVWANRMINLATAHVAAWGNIMPAEFARDWLQALAEACDAGRGGGMNCDDDPPIQWLCLGTTASGAPKHPLARGKHRVPPDFKPIPWKQ